MTLSLQHHSLGAPGTSACCSCALSSWAGELALAVRRLSHFVPEGLEAVPDQRASVSGAEVLPWVGGVFSTPLHFAFVFYIFEGGSWQERAGSVLENGLLSDKGPPQLNPTHTSHGKTLCSVHTYENKSNKALF